LAQLTFTLSAELEQDFRKKAGIVYGARKNSIGIALRDAIREFLVNCDISVETENMGNIGNSVLNKKANNLLPPVKQKNFEAYQRKQQQSKEDIEEKELTSKMPSDPEPSNDQLTTDREGLYREKNAISNKQKITEEDEQ
jgi:hypothetical protein